MQRSSRKGNAVAYMMKFWAFVTEMSQL